MTAAASPADLPARFRAAMRGIASTVCVVTARTPHGPRGMTATAVMSLSASPPTLAIAVNRSASLNPALGEGALLSIQALAEGQTGIADAFAGGLPPEARFIQGRWRDDACGASVLEDAAATFCGVVAKRIELASHSLLVVDVRTIVSQPHARPLLYAHGAYQLLAQAGQGCAA